MNGGAFSNGHWWLKIADVNMLPGGLVADRREFAP